ncbi:hypothetical protein VIGAN_08067200 [Vigna angularis var. angularis]|uniref:Cupin type-1 domain-containing protein n=1 Tax=Vigna angularis var. angularis TaxID=157739 RepID=A0A0S3SMS9_PHAAN|nr:beta-conglycinin alpha subunit 2 [Vigna angularis]BAT94101.1 hypothetical protein VIGAN_08067200 [Vigna angularis var. angularis]
MMRSRFPLLLLLWVVFLASVSGSFGIAYWEKENLCHNKCLRSCSSEKSTYRFQACHARCNLLKEDKEHQEVDESRQPRPFPIPFPIPIPLPLPPREHESEGSESSRKQENPFHFSSNRFHSLFKNSHGHIRLLQRFDQQSKQLQNLEDYRLLEVQLRPHTLLLPHHVDADYIIIILSGRAILTLENPDDSDSYNLQNGDVQKIPAGRTLYLINPDNEETLKVMVLARPINNPAKLETFFLSSTEVQQSYLQGFSKKTLEASFDTQFKKINRVLFGEEGKQQDEESRQEGVIVKLTKEQIRELSKHAKSSSKKTISSKDKPFNLRSGSPIYSNTLGKFYEITPEKNPQLHDMDVFVSFVNMKEGALLLPHYNSKSIVILVVNEGEANVELVGVREQQQEESGEVQRYRAELSEEDVLVIPATYPVAINATSSLNFFAFGINAENNQRNFLAGEKDNVMSDIPRQVLEVAFPGSGEETVKLIKKQTESYFVDAQPQQKQSQEKEKEEGSKGRNSLYSILNAFY